MKINYGKGTTKYGTGVQIDLSGEEVVTAISSYLNAHGVHVNGSQTIKVNGVLVESGECYVDPSGFVIANGEKYSGIGYEDELPYDSCYSIEDEDENIVALCKTIKIAEVELKSFQKSHPHSNFSIGTINIK